MYNLVQGTAGTSRNTLDIPTPDTTGTTHPPRHPTPTAGTHLHHRPGHPTIHG
ncbi:hypothetical protein SAMN05421595_0063 [Austwickia chelonae]|uniref:Uncharacterized protein n=1 Tax=Austwickia chelonae NBRC 105200 TaxID=1184607 RepID=K6WAI3_9MICO|nr:hypothetical protein [Austwickia chelonae]GAB78852.1 hypothetical protein AUCHE_17_00640 [Austwickia chelonae NBRC 105200]SEV85317.1 hypothetical protein SAMN05421595_0063 [Austwickia chelonae]